MRKYIPNILTSMNVLSGCIACVMAFEGNYLWVIVWIIVAAVCDFFDGFSARLLRAYSPIGKELDSLADMVSFGLAPSILIFRFLSDSPFLNNMHHPCATYIPYIGFMIAVFSALRLAKFNVDERQTTSFIGLPTPANALFWISLCYSLNINRYDLGYPLQFYMVLGLVIVMSLLLTSEISMFSLKIKSLKFKGNELRYGLIVFMIIAIVLGGLLGIAVGIIVYILLSVISSKISNRDSIDSPTR